MDTLPSVSTFLATPKQLLINGEWVDSQSGNTFAVENPANQAEFAHAALGDVADVDLAVAAARAAFEGEWQKVQPVQRGVLLARFADLVEEDAETLGQLISLENGKPYVNGVGEARITANILRYFSGWATKLEGSTIPVSPRGGQPILNYTVREAVGVCAMVVPWNFPLSMCAWKLGPALTVGCTAVLKPAEQTPLAALRLGELAMQAGYPAGVVNVLTGFGPEVGAGLASHMDVDKIAFTGSTRVGKLIAAAALSNMKKVSLELGGKSPNVIMPDADLDRAAQGAADGIFFNQGQVCTAASRLYVHESVLDEVLERLKAHAQAIQVGPGMAPGSTMGPLVSKPQFDTVTGYVNAALEEGAELICGGKQPAGLEDGYYYEPTIFLDRNETSRICREEIFGPVLVVMPWSDEDDLVGRANNSQYGLAAGVWTNQLQAAHRIADRLSAGSVWVNCWNVVDPASPFGGYKESGWGREMGKDVLDAYTETKSVFVDLSE